MVASIDLGGRRRPGGAGRCPPRRPRRRDVPRHPAPCRFCFGCSDRARRSRPSAGPAGRAAGRDPTRREPAAARDRARASAFAGARDWGRSRLLLETVRQQRGECLELSDAVPDRHSDRYGGRRQEHPGDAREPCATKRDPRDRRRDGDEPLDRVRHLLRVLVIREQALRLGSSPNFDVRREQARECLADHGSGGALHGARNRTARSSTFPIDFASSERTDARTGKPASSMNASGIASVAAISTGSSRWAVHSI
jgi:hypothetical protein